MSLNIQFIGAAGEVTGSCHLVTVGDQKILVDCAETAELWRRHNKNKLLPNLHISRTTKQSMAINRIRRGAIIIAGSGMCTGGVSNIILNTIFGVRNVSL